jgi:hypothetical protein
MQICMCCGLDMPIDHIWKKSCCDFTPAACFFADELSRRKKLGGFYERVLNHLGSLSRVRPNKLDRQLQEKY